MSERGRRRAPRGLHARGTRVGAPTLARRRVLVDVDEVDERPQLDDVKLHDGDEQAHCTSTPRAQREHAPRVCTARAHTARTHTAQTSHQHEHAHGCTMQSVSAAPDPAGTQRAPGRRRRGDSPRGRAAQTTHCGRPHRAVRCRAAPPPLSALRTAAGSAPRAECSMGFRGQNLIQIFNWGQGAVC